MATKRDLSTNQKEALRALVRVDQKGVSLDHIHGLTINSLKQHGLAVQDGMLLFITEKGQQAYTDGSFEPVSKADADAVSEPDPDGLPPGAVEIPPLVMDVLLRIDRLHITGVAVQTIQPDVAEFLERYDLVYKSGAQYYLTQQGRLSITSGVTYPIDGANGAPPVIEEKPAKVTISRKQVEEVAAAAADHVHPETRERLEATVAKMRSGKTASRTVRPMSLEADGTGNGQLPVGRINHLGADRAYASDSLPADRLMAEPDYRAALIEVRMLITRALAMQALAKPGVSELMAALKRADEVLIN